MLASYGSAIQYPESRDETQFLIRDKSSWIFVWQYLNMGAQFDAWNVIATLMRFNKYHRYMQANGQETQGFS